MIKEGVVLGKRYEILNRIGSGGMADVYKGKDHKLNRFVAVKVLKSDFRSDETFIQKFLSEAQAAAGLMHPNVVNVYDVGQDRGLYYMVMELVDGITLKDYIEKKGQLSAKETISIAIQMMNGIQAAHSKHIVHRDIKPQNIIISKEGKVKVTDFGIARATTSAHTVSTNVMGSVHYTSPEQARGAVVNERSDIYSAGIAMYEMITGRVPFDGDSTVTVALKHLQEDVRSPVEEVPDIPYSLEQIILKCTRKNPRERYQSCRDLITDLKRSLDNPEGDFVNRVTRPRRGDETVVMSEDELKKVHLRSYDDEDEDDDDDLDGAFPRERVDPNTKKVMKILLVVAAVIIAFVILFMAARALDLFSLPSRADTEDEVELVEVPDLVGLTREEAIRKLNELELGFIIAGREASDEFDEDVVMRQEIRAGEEVERNSQIGLIISTGPDIEMVEVPDVVGREEADAERILREAGLEVERREEFDDSVEEGRVISTNPTARTEVEEGSRVLIVVSRGQENVRVPSLAGMTEAEARAALTNAELTLGTITHEYSSSVASGRVISQSVVANTEVEPGTTVNIVISRGEETVTVPSLSGMTEAQARNALTNAGLVVGTVTQQHSNSVTAGYVISQTAAGGSSVSRGTSVGFIVSRGPEQVTPPPPPPPDPND